MKKNELKVGQIGYLNINTGEINLDQSAYYARVEVKVICKEMLVWKDDAKLVQKVKKYLEVVRQ